MAESIQDEKVFSPPNPQLNYAKLYLPLAPRQIRLLRLLPDTWEGSIHCQLLQEVMLPSSAGPNHLVSYEALSYCAGDPNDYLQIIVDGFQFNTFASTHGALRRLRFEDRPRLMWVDQICINQIDIGERNQQVAFMAEIYSAATKVLIWTGERCDEPESQLIFKLIDILLAMFGTALEKAKDAFAIVGKPRSIATKRWLENFFTGKDLTLLSASANLQQMRDFIVDFFCDPGSLATWKAIAHFFRRPYWSRMWIIQEIVLSSDATIVCGVDSCELLDFLSVMAVLMSIAQERYWDRREDVHPEFWKFARHILGAWIPHAHCTFQIWTCLHSRPVHLVNMLSLIDQFSATDPRDKVYALLGLLSKEDRDRLNIQIDYSRKNTPMHTLVHVAHAWIKGGCGLYILGCIRGDEDEVGLPSWVPNFYKDLEHRRGVYSHVHEAGWKACGSTQVQAKFFGDARILSLEAAIVGQIRDHGGLGIVDSATDYEKHSEHLDVVRSWQRLMDNVFAETTSQMRHDFWRTLSMDFFAEVRDEEDDTLWESRYVSAVIKCRGRYTSNRRFCILPGGLMGLIPNGAQDGDVVVLFSGGHVPFVVREWPGLPMFRLIGECYIRKIMDGSLMMSYLKNGKSLMLELLGARGGILFYVAMEYGRVDIIRYLLQ